MIVQDLIWAIALTGIGLVAVVFLVIVLGARRGTAPAAREKSRRTASRIQGWFFAVLLVGFVVGSWATLHNFPIPAQAGDLDADQVVNVTGGMWYWQMEPDSVPAGTTVEFRVTSVDVNHGFGLYAPDGRIVTQTQAMPEYTNRLLYHFTEPGTYTVQCLEYCGLGHAPMRTTFEVAAAEEN